VSGDQPAVVVVKEHTGTVVSDRSSPGSVVVRERSGAVTVVSATKGPTGPPGPEGPPGQWEDLTQAEFDALDPPDPDTLYVIIG